MRAFNFRYFCVLENLLEYYKVFRIITKEDIQRMGKEVERREEIESG